MLAGLPCSSCHAPSPLFLFLLEKRHDPGYGTAPDPTVCRGKKARLQEADCEFAAAPGPDSLGWTGWTRVVGPPLTAADFDSWPSSTGLSVKFSSFWGFLALAFGREGDLVMGVSFVEMLILYRGLGW